MRSKKEVKAMLEGLNNQTDTLWSVTQDSGTMGLPAFFNHLGKIEALEWVLGKRDDLLTE